MPRASIISSKKILAIVPARANSKGIVGKNMALLGGLPLLSYTLQAAKETSFIDRLVVSTDGKEIAAFVRGYGCEVVERPAALSGDRATTASAISHCLETLAKDDYYPDLIILLQPTSPFRTEEHISNAFEQYLGSSSESLVTACPISQHPCEAVRESNGSLTFAVEPPSSSAGRQTYPEYYFINGAIYIFSLNFFRQEQNTWNRRSLLSIMDIISSFEIDEPQHLELAEALLKSNKRLQAFGQKALRHHMRIQ